ncbi:hypothetical protein [Streptomyces sp. NPDC001415]
MAKGPGCYSWVGVGELADEVTALVPAACHYCHGERVAPAVEEDWFDSCLSREFAGQDGFAGEVLFQGGDGEHEEGTSAPDHEPGVQDLVDCVCVAQLPGVHSSCAGGGVRGQTDEQAPCRSLRGVLTFEDLGGEGLKEGCRPSGEIAVIALKAAAMSA